MENRDFADFELTKLLPDKNNVYKRDKRFKCVHINSNNTLIYCAYNELIAWSWEDIRLFLKNKNIEYCISVNNFKHDECKVTYKAVIDLYGDLVKSNNYTDVIVLDEKEYEFYEEARVAAIKYCLELIKSNK
jgi:hypothetical protein